MSTDPDQIRSEIDQTQRELSADVDALTDKLSPQRIVERRVRAYPHRHDEHEGQDHGQHIGRLPDNRLGGLGVGESVSARVSAARDTVAGTASSAVDTVRSAPDTARRSTQGNPLAAGLIAFGAGWLLSALLPASEPEQRVASQVKDFAAEQGRPVAEQLGQAGQQAAQELKESAQQRAEAVKETAADAASTVTGEAQSAASDVTARPSSPRAGCGRRAGARVRPAAARRPTWSADAGWRAAACAAPRRRGSPPSWSR